MTTPAATGAAAPAVSSTALSDHLPASVPRLDPSGLNWAIFSIRFQDAVEAKGFWGHFDGSKAKPVPADAAKPTDDEQARSYQTRRSCEFMPRRPCVVAGRRLRRTSRRRGPLRKQRCVRSFWNPNVLTRAMLRSFSMSCVRSTIISSLPIPLANFASNQLAAAKLYAQSKTIAPGSLIALILSKSRDQRMRR